MAHNHVHDTTEGFFSRWAVVPFTAFFPAGVARTDLIDVLTSHNSLQGLLRGAVGGLQQVMRRGRFSLPASVEAATARFRDEADPVRAYMGDRVRFHHENERQFTARSDIYASYAAWAVLNGFQALSAQRFYETFTMSAIDMGEWPARATIMDGTRGYMGITIK